MSGAGPLGLSPVDYRRLIDRLATQLATADDGRPDLVDGNQRAADEETASWLLDQLYAAGYVPRPREGEAARPGSALLTIGELAAALGIPLPTLHKNIRALRRDSGFPSPVPGSGGRYDPIAVLAWRRARAGLAASAAPPAPPQLPDVEFDWQAELDRRSATIGAA